MTIKLLVVDDHEVVRQGVKALLRDTEVKVVGEAATGEEAVRLVTKTKPHLVLLDILLGAENGLDALARIKLDHPKLAVLIFSTYDNPMYIARAVALGAAGYMLKGATRAKILSTIRAAAAGQSTWKRDEQRRLTGALATPRINADIESPLTQRESEVLRHLALGQTNKEIAQALEISYETVKEHVQHILRKIGVSDRTQAAIWSVRKGLV